MEEWVSFGLDNTPPPPPPLKYHNDVVLSRHFLATNEYHFHLQEAEKKQTIDKINELKKETKSLTAKLKFLHNPTKKNQKQIQQDSGIQQQKKIPLPKGAKTFEDGVNILDLQIIDLQKQIDLYQAKIVKKQEQYDKLHEEHQKLVSYKNEKSAPACQERPPETQEEDQNRKVSSQYPLILSLCERQSFQV